jgi:hypothetical protein
MSSFTENLPPETVENLRVTQMKQIQAEALELFTRKNADYGDAFAKYGVIGVLMRIEDNSPTKLVPRHCFACPGIPQNATRNVYYQKWRQFSERRRYI